MERSGVLRGQVRWGVAEAVVVAFSPSTHSAPNVFNGSNAVFKSFFLSLQPMSFISARLRLLRLDTFSSGCGKLQQPCFTLYLHLSSIFLVYFIRLAQHSIPGSRGANLDYLALNLIHNIFPSLQFLKTVVIFMALPFCCTCDGSQLWHRSGGLSCHWPVKTISQ